jgi:hypothetical protein
MPHLCQKSKVLPELSPSARLQGRGLEGNTQISVAQGTGLNLNRHARRKTNHSAHSECAEDFDGHAGNLVVGLGAGHGKTHIMDISQLQDMSCCPLCPQMLESPRWGIRGGARGFQQVSTATPNPLSPEEMPPKSSATC